MSRPKVVQQAPPDPVATANAQAGANVESAIATALLNQQNVVSPFGNVSFAQTGGQQVGDNFVPQFTRTVELTSDQQQQLDLENALGLDLTNLALDQTGRISGTLGTGIDTAGLPGLFGAVGTRPLRSDIGIDPLTNPGAFAPDVAAVEEATFQRGLNLLNPEFERQSRDLETALVNRGLPIDSEIAKNVRGDFNRDRSTALENLALSSVLAGRQEQGRLFDQALGFRGLEFGEALTGAQFGNQAELQRFNQAVQNAALSNAGRAQGIQEEAFERSLPIQDIAALLGTSPGVNLPQFQPTPAIGVASPDIIGTTLGSAQIAQQNEAARRRAQSGFFSGLFGLAGDVGAAAILSDIRKKTNIKRIGKTLKGFDLFEYVKDGMKEIGVIAQDVMKTLPEAVVEKNGYLAVRYEMVS